MCREVKEYPTFDWPWPQCSTPERGIWMMNLAYDWSANWLNVP